MSLFVPISTEPPPAVFESVSGHPVPRAGLSQTDPIPTNKFYANLFLGNRNCGVWCQPYQVRWTNFDGPSGVFGMTVCHVDDDKKVFGPNPHANPVQWYYNPVRLEHFTFSAKEFARGVSTLTLENARADSVTVRLRAHPDSHSSIALPLVQGMGFVTAIYRNLTPVFTSVVGFKSFEEAGSDGLQKIRLFLQDGSSWLLYALSNDPSERLRLRRVNPRHLETILPFSGIVQLTKCPRHDCEPICDAAAGVYAASVQYGGSVSESGSSGQYSFTFQRVGDPARPLLIFALPHHVDSFDPATTAAVQRDFQLRSTTKGSMSAVLADVWTMLEPDLPVDVGMAFPKSSVVEQRGLSPDSLHLIRAAAEQEVQDDMHAATNLDNLYFSAKALDKYAQLCYTVSTFGDRTMLMACLEKLKAAWKHFADNKQKYPLVYDSSWKGLTSSAAYVTGDPNAEFGATLYNDHHFHYSYLIHAAAVIGHIDELHGGTWTAANRDFVNALVRDVANPSTEDTHFPVFRAFDWFSGHAWAKGLFESADGKDEESSSEGVHFAHAMQLWGAVAGDAAMRARGALMLAVLRRSLRAYVLLRAGNAHHPARFVGNRVAGITFENKCDHATYFGRRAEYVQGIHMLPVTPATRYVRDPGFCAEEWATYFDAGRADAIAGGWRGVVYASLIVWDPEAAARFWMQEPFNREWLDGGMSLAYYRALVAYLGGDGSQ